MTIEKCVATVGKQAYDVEKTIEKIEQTLSKNDKVDVFGDILNPIEKAENPLEVTWGVAKTLYLGNSSLMPTKSYLTIHERARKATVAKFNSQIIFQKLTEFRTAEQNLTNDQHKRLVDKYILEGRLNGIELDPKKKEILNEILNKLRQEKTKFKDKLEISTKQFSHTINDYNLVREFPTELLMAMVQDPKSATTGPWKVTLEPHIFQRFMEYCPDDKLRWNVWQANVLKSGGYADRYLSNSVHIEEIRHLRKSQAKLLGFESFAEMSLKTKMADSLQTIQETLGNLLEHARPQQEKEISMLQQFAQRNGLSRALSIYDLPYWKRKHLINVYNLDLVRLRQYFPLPKVIAGLFQLAETLFNIKFKEHPNVDTWHENVVYFDILDLSKSDEIPIGGLYLDLYSREHTKICFQNANGWHVNIRNRCGVTNTRPLSALIFNFSALKPGAPALLSLADVKNLLSKFGNALQHLLTECDYSGVAGVSNVEWDAVETCGNVLVHFLYHPNVLKSMTANYTNQDPLPDDLIAALQEEWKHLAGYKLCEELYRSNLDLELHTKKDFWLDIVKRLWPQHIVFPLDKKDSHLCSFASIFSGQWGAAYYSHVWARLLAADVYSAFYEVQNDPDSVKAVGKRFRETYLALGGSCHPSEVFRRFRGRDPCPKALLKSLGLSSNPAS